MRGAALMQVRLRAVVKAAASLNIPFWRLPFVFVITQLILKKRMNEVQPYPGMPELIKKLAADGNELFIVSSNSTNNIKRFLRAHDLHHSFLKIYGNTRPRQKARMLKHIAAWRHVQQGGLLFVGDEDRDVLAGHAAQVPAIAVSWGYNDTEQLAKSIPTRTVATAHELSTVINEYL